MPLTTTRRELKNVRAYFVPSGTVLALGAGASSLTVGPTAAFPDNDPTTNYTDWEFPEVEDAKEEKTISTETFKIPDGTGGYFDDSEENETARKWSISTHKTNSLIKQLQHGLAAVPVVGTAQAYASKKDNYLEGVLLMEFQIKGGTVTERIAVWSRLRLKSGGDVGPTTAKIEISFEKRPNVYNSYLLVA